MRDIEDALARAILAQQRTRQAAIDIGERLQAEAKEAEFMTTARLAVEHNAVTQSP